MGELGTLNNREESRLLFLSDFWKGGVGTVFRAIEESCGDGAFVLESLGARPRLIYWLYALILERDSSNLHL